MKFLAFFFFRDDDTFFPDFESVIEMLNQYNSEEDLIIGALSEAKEQVSFFFFSSFFSFLFSFLFPSFLLFLPLLTSFFPRRERSNFFLVFDFKIIN